MTKKKEPLWSYENYFYTSLFDKNIVNSLKWLWKQSSRMPQMDKDCMGHFRREIWAENKLGKKYAQPQQLGKCKLKPQKFRWKPHAAGLGGQESDHTSL